MGRYLVSVDPDVDVEQCNVCIVGAGLAGLNALFVAGRYLSRGQRVILVDRRLRAGGMWVDTYPYVRLHQPHGMFTAGNIGWTLGRQRSYLATKGEVLDHFEYCLDIIREHVDIDEMFGWEAESEEETAEGVRIACRSIGGRHRVIEAKRLIKAHGVRVEPNAPLPLSSTRVRSVSPDIDDMRRTTMRRDDAPVWIIGGGKTAMDTAHSLITEFPGRDVNMIAGSGTFFMNRDKLFPGGARRWHGGMPLSSLGLQLARRFDGTNESEVSAWLRDNYGIWLTPETGNFFLGLLSESEAATVGAGLGEVVMDHLVDIVDVAGTTTAHLRSGTHRGIEAGSWIVNCTGYLLRDNQPYEPYISPHGRVLSVNVRSATLHLTSYIAYFMTHLMFLDRIRDIELYEIDVQELRKKSRAAATCATFSLVGYNLSLIADSVPAKVFTECGLDFDRWYPAPRRLLNAVRFQRTHRGERDRNRRALDTVRERYDVRCGPLVNAVR